MHYDASFRNRLMSTGNHGPYNVADAFVDRHLVEGRSDKIAMVCGGRRITYRGMAELVGQTGHALLRSGVQPEERVLVVLPDGPEFAAAYFGAMKIGAVAVPTSTFLHPADYAYALAESRARTLIVHASLLPAVASRLRDRARVPQVVVCGGGAPSDVGVGWDDWLSGCSHELEAAATTREDVAFWLWTSGSTGRPKAAVHLHGDWAICCDQYGGGVLGLTQEDVTFSASKLFHAYGLGNGLMFPFSVGATTVVVPDRPRATLVLETVQEQRPTVLFSVPTLYAAMLQESERTRFDLGSVRLAVSAAEPLPAAIFCRWRDRFGIEILDGIGSTEVLHIYLSARAGNVRPGSTGQAVPGYELRIVDPAGQDVRPGAIGDLLVSGESTAPCYWNRRALTVDRMRGRWFFTGDKYSMDADGFYWYAGRSDDMFRVSGQWVSPNEVENALIAQGSVLEAAVVAYEEETRLLTPKAFVVLRSGVAPGPDLVGELQRFVKQRIAPHQYPRRIEFLAELPKNASGKLLRHRLRERAEASPEAGREADSVTKGRST